jgi:hypothetical protein
MFRKDQAKMMENQAKNKASMRMQVVIITALAFFFGAVALQQLPNQAAPFVSSFPLPLTSSCLQAQGTPCMRACQGARKRERVY